MRAVNNVSFELRSSRPRSLAWWVPAGAGRALWPAYCWGCKSRLRGRATYLGKDISKLSRSEYQAFRADVQPVFQDPYSIFNPVYKVDRVFWKAIKKFKLARKKSDGLEIIRASLEAVKLDPDYVLGRYPHQLSGGQRQRLMLARVHMLRPSFIIADEPVSMLDAHVRQAFLEVLGEFREQYGMTTLFITHDLSTVAYLGGEMMTMYHGRDRRAGPGGKALVEPGAQLHQATRRVGAGSGPRQALGGPYRASQWQAKDRRSPEYGATCRKWRQGCPGGRASRRRGGVFRRLTAPRMCPQFDHPSRAVLWC